MVSHSQARGSSYLVEALGQTQDGVGRAHGHAGQPLAGRGLGGEAARGLEEVAASEHVRTDESGAEDFWEWLPSSVPHRHALIRSITHRFKTRESSHPAYTVLPPISADVKLIKTAGS